MNRERIKRIVKSIKNKKITANKIVIKSLFSSGGTVSDKEANQYLNEVSRLSGSK